MQKYHVEALMQLFLIRSIGSSKKYLKRRSQSERMKRVELPHAFDTTYGRVRQPLPLYIRIIFVSLSHTKKRVFSVQFSDPYLDTFWNFIKKWLKIVPAVVWIVCGLSEGETEKLVECNYNLNIVYIMRMKSRLSNACWAMWQW